MIPGMLHTCAHTTWACASAAGKVTGRGGDRATALARAGLRRVTASTLTPCANTSGSSCWSAIGLRVHRCRHPRGRDAPALPRARDPAQAQPRAGWYSVRHHPGLHQLLYPIPPYGHRRRHHSRRRGYHRDCRRPQRCARVSVALHGGSASQPPRGLLHVVSVSRVVRRPVSGR